MLRCYNTLEQFTLVNDCLLLVQTHQAMYTLGGKKNSYRPCVWWTVTFNDRTAIDIVQMLYKLWVKLKYLIHPSIMEIIHKKSSFRLLTKMRKRKNENKNLEELALQSTIDGSLCSAPLTVVGSIDDTSIM